MLDIISEIKKSKKFVEGENTSRNICDCEKCKISRYRHTHEPELADPDHSFWDYLKFCISEADTDGIWMEFGVGSGTTISFISENRPEVIIYGFDSFFGLPEDWNISDEKTHKKNHYSRNGIPPEIERKNVKLIKGLFTETLPDFCKKIGKRASFIHIDCDLYSSTKQVLDILHTNSMLKSGTVILFDEFYNYQNFKEYEFKAFIDFFEESKLSYRWIAHTESFVEWNGNQAALKIL